MLDLKMQSDNNAAGMAIGVLAIRNIAGTDSGTLKQNKQALEEELRKRYGLMARGEMKSLHPMDVYVAYYKKFGYTYHVLPQLESIVRGKDIPDVLPAVAAMFMAELKNMLLTAGHDLDKVVLPLRLMRSSGNEIMPALSGKDVTTVREDYMISDREGVISAILRGCDARTAMTGDTRNVIYTAYAPDGIDTVLIRRHLDDIEAYIRMMSKAPETLMKEVYNT
jgi:DNA/RNA-binding domain of Phe-tRNA-synthetase-like protein